MITLETELDNGRRATVNAPETPEDYLKFTQWLHSHQGEPVAVDTETTGLEIYGEGFCIRTVQVGIGLEAWVINTETHGITRGTLEQWFEGRDLYFHNATYDVLALEQCYGYRADWSRITDTMILAHLVDSRGVREGGPGHSLSELTRTVLKMPKVADGVKGSIASMAKEIGCTKSELFSTIDAWNETYLGYAGMDVVLTYGLHNQLQRMLEGVARKQKSRLANTPFRNQSVLNLVRYEHEVARVCAEMQRNGFLLDVEYAQTLDKKLEEEQTLWEGLALIEYGIESVNQNSEVALALEEFDGAKLTELTPSGNKKLDEAVLTKLSDEGSRLAAYVLEAKKVKKQRASWVQNFLNRRDSEDRCHAGINTLAARTGRMSITGIPAQTLPSGDWTIRRCFIPDEGQSIVSCDYQAQELRVLAALSGDKNMKEAFATGADLHQMTADASGVERSVGKTVNFAYVYGSGPRNIAETCGITVEKAREVIQGFERTYPGVKKLADRLQAQAKSNGCIDTVTGRVLHVDKDRAYAALNYMIQSTSRDITARALLRMDEEGITPYLRLPIHDEVVASVPSRVAEGAAQKIASLMEANLFGVHIGTDAEVYGPSWGSGYVTDETRSEYEATLK